MNGVHDMGGQQGYGPVQIEANEPLFHGEWERRALGVTVAMGASGLWNIDLARSARESLPPLDYVQGPYYAIWTKALQKLLIERGLITEQELAQDVTAAGTDSPADADLPGALGDRYQHDVHDPDSSHQQGNGR